MFNDPCSPGSKSKSVSLYYVKTCLGMGLSIEKIEQLDDDAIYRYFFWRNAESKRRFELRYALGLLRILLQF